MRIEGTHAATGGTVRVKAHVGVDLTGALIGDVRVRDDGTWRIRVDGGPSSDSSHKVNLESTAGGVLLAVPLR